jgi:multiple sugar transport system substrate-binding protein
MNKWQKNLLVAAGIASAIMSLSVSRIAAQSSNPVKLVVWSWLQDFDKQIAAFEASHPNIKIELVNVGVGDPEYIKLRAAFKAGTGAPDVAFMEYQYIPSFALTKSLVDLAPYGVGALKTKYVPWTWAQVSQGEKVYGLPLDMAPMAFYYRKDIFDQYKIKVPRTWDDYAKAARAIRKANPKLSIGTIPSGIPPLYNALLWQAGWRPFKVDGANISVNVNDASAQKVGKYWEGLINEKVLSSVGDFSPDWTASFANGTLVGQLGAAWLPLILVPSVPTGAGKWRVAQLPQWKAGDRATANFGGSTLTVTSQSKHPKEAAEFLKWASSDPVSIEMFRTVQKGGLFSIKSFLNNPAFLDEKDPYFGGQRVNEFFADASRNVDTDFQWSPFQDFVYGEMGNQFGQATGGKQSFDKALENIQNNIVNFAKAQGFTVK